MPIANKLFVFTGKVARHTRQECWDIVKRAGGSWSDRVTRRVDYLVVAGWPHSHSNTGKLQSAKLYGVDIISDTDFINMIRQATPSVRGVPVPRAQSTPKCSIASIEIVNPSPYHLDF